MLGSLARMISGRAAVGGPSAKWLETEPLKDMSLTRRMLAAYDATSVDTTLSPGETMPGENYMNIGASAAAAITAAVMSSRLTKVANVLDLPCGHGRVLRHLIKLFPDARADACDLDRAGVEFCARTFGARAIHSQSDLTRVQFDTTYDLIWIGSLFTHTSLEITRKWLAYLTCQLSQNGILVATFHGRWATKLHRLVPYIDDAHWKKIIEGYDTNGYGYADYPAGGAHDFITTSYGISVAKAHTIVGLLEEIPGTRIITYMEKGWGNNHDVIAIGRPDWNEGDW